MSNYFKKHKYLVAFHGDNQTCYGKNEEYADPLTIYQANIVKKRLEIGCPAKATIYKLVPIRAKINMENKKCQR